MDVDAALHSIGLSRERRISLDPTSLKRLKQPFVRSKITFEPLSYPVFMPKPSTHRMHDPGSIVPHIRPKVFTDNQMSRIKYNYYINNVSTD
jgi:hypothetical protein